MFEPLPNNPSFPALEGEVLSRWKAGDVYEKSLQNRKDAERFVFYEGPPTANGMPHPGHCLTRSIKDLFPRYKTMRGFLCERKAGWDTHGLPVEVEVCRSSTKIDSDPLHERNQRTTEQTNTWKN